MWLNRLETWLTFIKFGPLGYCPTVELCTQQELFFFISIDMRSQFKIFDPKKSTVKSFLNLYIAVLKG